MHTNVQSHTLTRIRAGVPKGWTIADKTGASNSYGVSNDVAIIWPPKCAPSIIAAYSSHYQQKAKRRDDILAAATRMLLNEFAKTDVCFKLVA